MNVETLDRGNSLKDLQDWWYECLISFEPNWNEFESILISVLHQDKMIHWNLPLELSSAAAAAAAAADDK